MTAYQALCVNVCVDHNKQRVLEKKLYGVEDSSSFLECIPKSLQAKVTWTYQRHPNNPREEVRHLGAELCVCVCVCV